MTHNYVEDDIALQEAVHSHSCHIVRNQGERLVAFRPDEDNHLRLTDQKSVYEPVMELAVVGVHSLDRRSNAQGFTSE